MHGDLVIIARLIDRYGSELALQFIAAITQRMVPDNFQAVIGNRERRSHNRFRNTIAVRYQFANQSIIARRLVNKFRMRTSDVSDKHPRNSCHGALEALFGRA